MCVCVCMCVLGEERWNCFVVVVAWFCFIWSLILMKYDFFILQKFDLRHSLGILVKENEPRFFTFSF